MMWEFIQIKYCFGCLFLLHDIKTIVVANLCVRSPLDVKDKGIRGVGGTVDKDTCTVHTINIISQWQYFVARCLSSYVGNVFGLNTTLSSDVEIDPRKLGQFIIILNVIYNNI
jgi:hypothetical protein